MLSVTTHRSVGLPGDKSTTSDGEGGVGGGIVLLFYKYVPINDTERIKDWQHALCVRLGITGKIRISKEGINVTVGGDRVSIEQYKQELLSDPRFSDIKFKSSPGGVHSFDNLKVSVVQEAIPINLPPGVAPADKAAPHLTPEEAHYLLSHPPPNLVILDARNYYESRIGHFRGAILPPIRKFSQFPQYLNQNIELLKDKTVFMYCTGGVRCERASAYLSSLNVASQIYQLEGGIHQYIDKYPDGYFRGKNYVFDNRIALPANGDVLSRCNYCRTPYDRYALCCRPGCCIVSLCCDSCREQRGGLFYCCTPCEGMHRDGLPSSPCWCTNERLKYIDVEEYYEDKMKNDN